MAASCPVVFHKVDEHLIRTHALMVTLTALGYVWSTSDWLLVLLVYDFAMRVLFTPRGSPLFLVSSLIVRLLPLAAKPVDAGPKKFAAKVGLLFVTAGLVCVAGGCSGFSLWLISVMALFAALEASCGFCVGCKLYSLLSPLFIRA